MSGVSLAAVVEYCRRQGEIRASARQWQVLHHIEACRTARLGSALYHCAACRSQWLWHHSCRDRHCPRCQHQASEAWCEKQRQQLLPVPYFHLVFTLPHELNAWAARHGELLYRLLFRCCWQTLDTLGQRKVKGQLGMTAVLHTWGQTLTRHIHLHCLIPAGVLLPGQRWKGSHKGYLLPVKALSKRFRGLMVSALRSACREGRLADIAPSEVDQVLAQLMSKPWVVYSKSALHYRETLVHYLARYSHRIGLSDRRLLRRSGDTVTLAYHDYRRSSAATLQLRAGELLRRFLLHVLPKGFMRIRHYGYLANAIKGRCLPLIRKQLEGQSAAPDERQQQPGSHSGGPPRGCCPRCGHQPIQRMGDVEGRRAETERIDPG